MRRLPPAWTCSYSVRSIQSVLYTYALDVLSHYHIRETVLVEQKWYNSFG